MPAEARSPSELFESLATSSAEGGKAKRKRFGKTRGESAKKRVIESRTTRVGTKDPLLASFEAPAVYCWTVSATSAGRKQD